MEPMEAAPEVRSWGRLARRLARSRRQRRWVAALLAVVGASAAIAAFTFRPAAEDPPRSSRTAGSTAEPAEPAGAVTAGTEAKPPSTAPGGVGENPEKTGLPAVPAEGGLVRTGSADDGCFDNVREYLEEWDRTGKEPDPCFTKQPPSNQDQPEGVQRTYNGEKF